MKKNILMVLMMTAATMVFAEGKPQAKCPVMGGAVNTNLYVDAEGYRIYVCCEACINTVKADPEKYIKKMQAGGVELQKVPAAGKTEHPGSHSEHPHNE
jgi:YHS domain-containing protein